MSKRFVVNDDGTVRDSQTGLVWQKDTAPERMTWPEAQRYIQRLNESRFAGFADWRLPSTEELTSLMLFEENSWRLYLDRIFGKQSCYWSSTTRGHHMVCYVDFYYGGVYRFQENYVNHSVRAVRGAVKSAAVEERSAA
jgi:hypothetical protein